MRSWKPLILGLALTLTGSLTAHAASAETRAYNAAVKDFQDGWWDRAERECAQFVQQYPRSARVPEVLLLEVQAQFKQKKFVPAAALAESQQAKGGGLADQFLYWQAEALYAATNYPTAAEAYARLAREFPASTNRLAAGIGQAAARAKLGDWPRVVQLLQNPGGEFQEAVRSGVASELVARGRLLLAEAEVAQTNFPAAQAALQPLDGQPLPPELDWQRINLLCGVQMGLGQTNAAVETSSNLLALAMAAGRGDLLAQSHVLRAGIFENADDTAKAVDEYRQNLTTNAPVEQQRQAVLKMAVLAAAGDQTAEAEHALDDFCARFPDSPVADLALLTLGELQLKRSGAPSLGSLLVGTNTPPAGTNQLLRALGVFDRLITTYSNSPLVGRAQSGRGWCLWLEGQRAASTNAVTESASAFKAAVSRLPPSADRVIARLKWADAQFWLGDFAGARTNYHLVSEEFTKWPSLEAQWGAQALYQMERAGLELKDVATATNAVEELRQRFPTNELADRGLLALGQGYLDLGDTNEARATFERLIQTSPQSLLRPEAALAVAWTHAAESDWAGAITNLDSWLEEFPTNALRDKAAFYRAWANFQAGNLTNALTQFTNLVAQFPTSKLAPLAQQWVGDYYFGQHDYHAAEINYKLLFQNRDWPTSRLTYEAYLMAGRAAVGGQNYKEDSGAIYYFTNLTSAPSCPPDLKVQALMLYGDTLMQRPGAETNRAADLRRAAQIFGTIPQDFTNAYEAAAAAWGRIGDCYFQLAAQTQNPAYYNDASKFYRHAAEARNASVAVRSGAGVGLGLVAEKLADQSGGTNRIPLLRQARDCFLDVFYGTNLRDGEAPELFWVKEAGLNAARLAESKPLQDWEQAENVYKRLTDLLPQMRPALERKIADARAQAQRQREGD